VFVSAVHTRSEDAHGNHSGEIDIGMPNSIVFPRGRRKIGRGQNVSESHYNRTRARYTLYVRFRQALTMANPLFS
jgi:hypothetical protein